MKPINIGGQAVIEGVMMRGPNKVAVSVREPSGEIVTEVKDHIPWTKKHPLFQMPIIRGVVTLAESLVLGVKTLSRSANMSLQEDEKLGKGEMAFSLVLSLAMSIGLFIATPAFAFNTLSKVVPNTIHLNIIEGLIRISIFAGFVLIISRMKDMFRIFQYHGAEHKAVFAFEELQKKKETDIKDKLTLDYVKNFPTKHPRCGTSFLVIVMVVSIFMFSLFGRTDFFARVLLKLSFMPLIAGISYEFIRLSGKYCDNIFVKIVTFPGILFQFVTTQEPDDKQLEVAIASIKEVIPEN